MPDTTLTAQHPRPVVLCILDGFGYREDAADNAIKQASTPFYDSLWQSAPRSWLKTSGLAVGLPEGQMGNSEVGHMTLGSGRVVLQDLPRINQATADGSFKEQPAYQDFVDTCLQEGGTLHMLGLLSPGGVHSHMAHMLAAARYFTEDGLEVAIHAFLDGRDTPPRSAADYVAAFEAELPAGAYIATVSGRYYAMDRDKRWDRVSKAWAAIVEAKGNVADSAADAVASAYASGTGDEFILPTIIGSYAGAVDGDSLFMANFRADRAREILESLIDPEFDGFERGVLPPFTCRLGMVDYSDHLSSLMPALFPAENITQSLGECLEANGRTQLRIAETEKYAHVTFFFSGGREDTFKGEDRILIPSPDVATYDLKPEMSAFEVTDALTQAIDSGKYDAIVVNYANPDMVGHTGDMQAAMKAVETVDQCLTRLNASVAKAGGLLLITADHGNVELMRDPDTGAPHTAHTDFDVPLVLAGNTALANNYSLKDGSLADIAPTVMALLGLEQPDAMTGSTLAVPLPQNHTSLTSPNGGPKSASTAQ